jgi:hypothetical protein
MFCLLPLEMYPPLSPLQANTGMTSTYKTERRKSKRERKGIIVIMPELADSGHLEANANDSKKVWSSKLISNFLGQSNTKRAKTTLRLSLFPYTPCLLSSAYTRQ